jgi:hypothetical protein
VRRLRDRHAARPYIKLSLKFGETREAARSFADLIKRFVTPLNWLSILNR